MKTEIAVFGGGCFWCTEAVFKMLKGVMFVGPGYAGGFTDKPIYKEVSEGDTGHAEVVRVEYDPALVSYRDLLTVFFAMHDPTTPNRQGNDRGPQYRSIILYTNEKQKSEAETFIKELNESDSRGAPIVTEVKPLEQFFEAEEEHKDYYAQNRKVPYCQIVINPKLKKVKEQFAALLS